MQRESNWRIYFVVIVTLLCLYFIYPTTHYIFFELTTKPPVKSSGMTDTAFKADADKYDKTRQNLQRGAIKLGLDLVGGVDVLLKIDEEKARGHLLSVQKDNLGRLLDTQMIGRTITTNNTNTGLVLRLTDKTNARQAVNAFRDYVKNGIFDPIDEGDFERTGQTELKLANLFLQRKIGESIQSAEKTVRERVDKFGVTQPSVSLQGMNSIRVQVPGEKDPEYVIQQVIRPAQLEFYPLYEDNDTLAGDEKRDGTLYERVKTKNERGEDKVEFRLRAGASMPPGYKGMIGEETSNPEGAIAPIVSERMYIVKQEPEMRGGTLQDAYVETNPAAIGNPIEVGLTFDRAGADEFRRLSKKYLHKRVAIALDGKIHSAPVFQTVIPDGRAVITGNFSPAEGRDLALVLKAGAMPADLQPTQKSAIGPTLGAQSIQESIRALIIAAGCITAFMIIYYGTAGVISIVALILNILLVLACLNLFNATLTLSGIGGLILTIGMAVDTNVLIYERVREELLGGREIKAALRTGFNRAFSVIVDSHLTTLLTAAVLLQFGKGSVAGFALTMCFGLIANLFTGLTVTYAICSLWVRYRNSLGLGVLAIFRNPKIDFIGMRYLSFGISGVTLLIALFILFVYPRPQYAVDFQGGLLSEVRLLNEKPGSDQSKKIELALTKAGLAGEQARVQRIRGVERGNYLVRVALQADPAKATRQGDVTYTQERAEGALRSAFGAEEIQILGTESVSSEVGQQFQQIALFLVIASSIAILVYLWFRFELVFGVAAVLALLHDFLITLGLLVLLKYQVSLDIVSGLMVLLGFSVNDTIVIFDRVRENSQTMYGKPFRTICNSAMNRSLSRTLITSGTVLLVMVIMFFFGGYSLKPFAVTMVIGSIIGTYSSDFIATPLVFWWNEREKGRLGELLGQKKTGPQSPERQLGAATPVAATVQNRAQQPHRGRR